MPYHEESFLNGLIYGLTATDGRPLNATRKTLLTGIRRMTGVLPDGAFDTFVSRVSIKTNSPVTILYEYGPADGALSQDFRRVAASNDAQTVHHVIRTERTFTLRQFRYNVYLLERDDMEIRFEGRFMSFPYADNGTTRNYPGSPEQVTVWWTRASR